MRTDLILLELAKRDLKAAECLSSQKLYSYSVFHLQQAVEKAVKSFGIWNKIITEIEAKNTIGHEAWKLYLNIVDQTKNRMIKLKEVLNKFPKLNETGLIKELNLSEWEDKIQNYKQAFNFLSRDALNLSFSNEKLQTIMNEICKLKKELKEIFLSEITLNEEELNDFRKKLHEFFDAMSESEIDSTITDEVKNQLINVVTPQLIASIFKVMKEFFSKLIFCSLSLFYLSLIFSSHAVKSRYPQDDFNPLEAYNDKMPLIQMLDFFIRITEETLEDLDYILHYQEFQKEALTNLFTQFDLGNLESR